MSAKVLVVVALCGALLASSGCALLLLGAGAAAGAGTVVYFKGQLQSNEEVSMAKADAAVRATIDNLGYPITSQSEEKGVSMSYVARKGSDTDVRITLEKLTNSSTRIKIRVGLMGDQAASQQILEKIRSNY